MHSRENNTAFNIKRTIKNEKATAHVIVTLLMKIQIAISRKTFTGNCKLIFLNTHLTYFLLISISLTFFILHPRFVVQCYLNSYSDLNLTCLERNYFHPM
jgi:hypothetical protein